MPVRSLPAVQCTTTAPLLESAGDVLDRGRNPLRERGQRLDVDSTERLGAGESGLQDGAEPGLPVPRPLAGERNALHRERLEREAVAGSLVLVAEIHGRTHAVLGECCSPAIRQAADVVGPEHHTSAGQPARPPREPAEITDVDAALELDVPAGRRGGGREDGYLRVSRGTHGGGGCSNRPGRWDVVR